MTDLEMVTDLNRRMRERCEEAEAKLQEVREDRTAWQEKCAELRRRVEAAEERRACDTSLQLKEALRRAESAEWKVNEALRDGALLLAPDGSLLFRTPSYAQLADPSTGVEARAKRAEKELKDLQANLEMSIRTNDQWAALVRNFETASGKTLVEATQYYKIPSEDLIQRHELVAALKEATERMEAAEAERDEWKRPPPPRQRDAEQRAYLDAEKRVLEWAREASRQLNMLVQNLENGDLEKKIKP